MKHVILDYDVGNLDSVLNGFLKVGIDAVVSKNPEVIKQADSLILPGVGAFKDAMISLEKSGLIPLIINHINQDKYLFGICLGMQLLYETSYEFGAYQGLGVLNGDIVRFNDELKVPHMGWNDLYFKKEDPLLKYINKGDFVYFVHSYYVKSSNEEVVAFTQYGVDVPAIVRKGNIYATQFHPEKSGEVGSKILKAYGEMIYDNISSN